MTKKRGRGRPRKNGSSNETKLTTPQRKKNKGKIALFHEGTVTHKIYDMILSGKTEKQIADDLEITPNAVSKHVAKALKMLDEETMQLVNHYRSISSHQIDAVLSKVMVQIEGSEIVDPRIVSSFLSLVEARQDLFQQPQQNGSQNNVQVNVLTPTFNSTNPLYQEAMENMSFNQPETPPLLVENIPELNDEKAKLVDSLDDILSEYEDIDQSEST